MTLQCFVFWPAEDTGKSGYFYGWRHPRSVCAAGVLQVQSLGEAENQLSHFLSENAYFSTGNAVPSRPAVLGRCERRSSGGVPTLLFASDEAETAERPLTFVLYRRSSLGSLSFHPLDASSNTSSVTPGSNAIWSSDLGIDATTVDELNAAHRLHLLLRISDSWVSKLTIPEAVIWPTKAVLAITVRPLCAAMRRLLIMAATMFTPFAQLYSETSPHYVQFNNAIWLVLNDLVLGIAIGSFLCDNHVPVSKALHDGLETVFITFTRDALLWLDDWPAGLKLNTELSHFCCQTALGTLELWALTIRALAPYFPNIVYVLGLSGIGGLTMIVSLFLDMFKALTLHVFLSYLMLTRLFSYQMAALSSLWNLFRGKRFNMLHKHVDSWHYELDQLLLGTLLFTLVTFSLPTFLTYTLLFVLLRSAITLPTALLNFLVDLMNCFPLFALLLRVKDPRRLPVHVGQCQAGAVGQATIAIGGWQARANTNVRNGPAQPTTNPILSYPWCTSPTCICSAETSPFVPNPHSSHQQPTDFWAFFRGRRLRLLLLAVACTLVPAYVLFAHPTDTFVPQRCVPPAPDASRDPPPEEHAILPPITITVTASHAIPPATVTVTAPAATETVTVARPSGPVKFALVMYYHSSAMEGAVLMKTAIMYTSRPLEFHIICDVSAQEYLESRLKLLTHPVHNVLVRFYRLSPDQMVGRVEREGAIYTDHAAGTPGLMKLFIHEILPNDVDKAIFVDTDAFFLTDPALLYDEFAHMNESIAISMPSHPEQTAPEWHDASKICSCIMLLDLAKLRSMRLMDSILYREDTTVQALAPPAFEALFGPPGTDGHYQNVALGDQGYWWAIVSHRTDIFTPLSYDWEVSSCLLDMYGTGVVHGSDAATEDEERGVMIHLWNTPWQGTVVHPKLLHFNCLHNTDIYFEWAGWLDAENSLTQRWGSVMDYHVGTKWIWLNRGSANLTMETVLEPQFADQKFAAGRTPTA
ncbi:glycosyltransferase family 8 protein [Auriscalpium vulgare]|uniref:Glycosyltransferase family 8 protein n=1 Tax=Auriscalpium vulgare TaxID=40419 RepID=A0ACB8S0M6_9AGAM|nr:glycosyltransferase family 8 protein [Auriscalpium vulgare]